MAAPTIDQARVAADLLVEEGARRVLLFGSLAAGAARSGSDVDLVAVFDDLGDYSRRHSLRWQLQERCNQRAGCSFDVHVTDWPEWKRRISEVSSSFEAHIAPGAVILADRPADGEHSIDWGKEIGLPASNIEEGLRRLSDTADCLDALGQTLAPMMPTASANRQAARHRRICAAAALTVENAVKALTCLIGKAPEHTHDINGLIQDLSGEQLRLALVALEPLRTNTVNTKETPYGDVSMWRQAGTYASEVPEAENVEAVAALVPTIASCALELASQIHSEFVRCGADPADSRVTKLAEAAVDMTAILAADGMGSVQVEPPA